MQLLTTLFPGLQNAKKEGMPKWGDMLQPWDIFSATEFGIISQIIEISKSENGVFIHPTARIGKFVEIEGPCYIGKNAEIRHSAYLRKGSWICEGALVGHSTEVKNSILLPNSKAPHFNYVGDSILGFGVNLGAGSKLSNVRNDRKEVILTMENGTRIKSGIRKIGALIGDESQLGCNVVSNPGTMIPPKTFVPPNETLTGWIG